MAFSFGSTSTPATATTTSSGFSFGTGTAGSTFGTSAFGAPAPAFGAGTTPSFGIGTAFSTSSAPTFGVSSAPAFGSTTTTFGTGSSIFGASAAPTFGGGTSTFNATTAFGSTATPAFGAGTSTFSGLGTAATSAFGFGQTQQQQQLTPQEASLYSVYKCNIFGDERDQIVGDWNRLQAFCGVGKGYYAQNAPPAEYTPQNTLCGLKCVGYSVKPKFSPSDALVTLCLNKKAEEVSSQQLQLESTLAAIFGNKPNITVHLDHTWPAPNNKCLVLIYVQEKAPNGSVRRVPSADVIAYLSQPSPKQQLTNMGVYNLYPLAGIGEEQLKEYADNPPNGLNSNLWKNAHLRNPYPEKLIPVPIMGFEDLAWRVKCQEERCQLHHAMCVRVEEDVAALKRAQLAANTKTQELTQDMSAFRHRILKIMVKMSGYFAEAGIPFGPEEENLKSRLEILDKSYTKPGGLKSQSSNLMAKFITTNVAKMEESSTIKEEFAVKIKDLLLEEGTAVEKLKILLEEDMATLSIIGSALSKLSSQNSDGNVA